MAIKLYYHKTTYQLITIDDNNESIVVGDDGGKEFHFYFGTGTNLEDYVNDVTIPVNYLGRAVIERPNGDVTNELYLTPVVGDGYFKLIVTDWISAVEGNLEITARLKASDGDGGYIIYPFTVATIPVEAGIEPGDDTITDAQYQAIQVAVDNVIQGTTDIAYDNTGTDVSAVTFQDAITELDSEIAGMKDGTEKFTNITVTDGDGNDMVITFDGKDPIASYRGVTGEWFKNLFLEVEPASGVTFTNGMAVMYAGSIGGSGKRLGKPTVLSELKVNPNLFIGIVTEVMSDGNAMLNWYGEVNGLNTNGLTLGAPVYVGDSGTWTTTKPTSPDPQIVIGLIERVNNAQGRISVRPRVGSYLGQLFDVYTNGHVFVGGETIKFNITNGRYEIYDLDGLIARVGALENANFVKSVVMNPSTYVLTITYFDDTTDTIDLPAEMAFVSASYDNVTKDLTFTLQNGSDVVVPLDDIISGLASEDWVTTYFIAKTQIVNDLTTGGATDVLSAEQGKTLKGIADGKEALANKATDFSTINDTKYPSVQAVRNYVRDIGLDTPIAELNNHSLSEVFEGGNLVVNGDFIIGNTELPINVQSGLSINVGDCIYITYLQENNLISNIRNTPYLIDISNPQYVSILANFRLSKGLYSDVILSNSYHTSIRFWGHTLNPYPVSYKQFKALNLNNLGISNLTVQQMDYWFSVYQALSTSTTYGFLNTLYDLFTSKANIAQEDWITPTLTTATTTYLKYRKDTLGTVIIEGNLTVTTAGTNFTLPTGYRPLFAYVQGDLTFNTDGTVVSASTGLKYINVRFTGGA